MTNESAPQVLPIATPYSSGTGFYLPIYGLVVTTEHLVRDNATVIVGHPDKGRVLMPVIYLDTHYDLAFLQAGDDWPRTTEDDSSPDSPSLEIDTPVIALGRPSGERRPQAKGTISQTDYLQHEIPHLRHDAWLDTEHGGGPLVNENGRLLGINHFDFSQGRPLALALPVAILHDCLREFQAGNSRSAARCLHCRHLNFDMGVGDQKHCAGCGKNIQLPSQVPTYRAEGIQATIEDIIKATGYDPRLSRQGPNLWEISQGSARIMISYHEDSGLLTGDAHLCSLPEDHPPELFEYLLQQNYALEQLTFSTRGRDIILSLLIYDRYLSRETALPRFEHLFERADYYDNVLVERFGAEWNHR